MNLNVFKRTTTVMFVFLVSFFIIFSVTCSLQAFEFGKTYDKSNYQEIENFLTTGAKLELHRKTGD